LSLKGFFTKIIKIKNFNSGETIMRHIRFFIIALSVCTTSFVSGGNKDWPQWRGSNRDSLSTESDLLQEWSESGPPLLWQSEGIGEGYSTVSIVGDQIFTMGDIGDTCCTLALDKSNGKVQWQTKIGKAGNPGNFKGPRSTPTVSGDFVVVLSQYGQLACLNRKTGNMLWKKHLEVDFGGKIPQWGYSESPLVDGKQVVCTPGGDEGAILALDLKTGQPLWQTKDFTDEAHYSSIVPAEIGGIKQYVQLTPNSVVGISSEGKLLWRAERMGKVAVIPTPIVHGNKVYVSSGYGIGCSLFEIIQTEGSFQPRQVYADKIMVNQHGGVLLKGDYLYGYCDKKGWMCQEFDTGKLVWAEKKQVGKGSLTYANGRLYLRAENKEKGTVALIEATPEGYIEKGRFEQPNLQKEMTWPHPVVAGGRLYIRDQNILLCYDIQQN
jgi:outer membrane protein assembly factor BamB